MVATMRHNQVGMSENRWHKAAPLTTRGSHGSWEFEGKRCKNKYITGHTTQVLSSTNLTEIRAVQKRFVVEEEKALEEWLMAGQAIAQLQHGR